MAQVSQAFGGMELRRVGLWVLIVGCSVQPELSASHPSTVASVRLSSYEEIGRTLDILFVIDGSPAMQPARSRLNAEVPRLLEMLHSGTQPDGSRTCTIQDMHVGVINTNMGAGRYPVPGRREV